MSEKTMRKRIIRGLRPLHAFAVETPTAVGVPDINFAGGWMECKWAKAWPVREDTIFRCDHFTKAQRLWLTKRSAVGEQTWVMLQVGRNWLLFQGTVAAELLGTLTKNGLYLCAHAYWDNGLNDAELIECLSH